ncbi:Multidrug efflux pump subunit AcrA (membrane-fusion protein) [Azotobacter beijerinckii]|uniref:Multidrug efflux pump subunit AcrA (Membrane-fusion protein) n=2 Tax=Azotobacter beijerinckii TaxID=170623 RepID=A0A1H9S2J4_9GAMM|nr:Multidrug efflux pump subunit AcrA (membrane-fusion protein) [Azotobacter beijerinckii]
MMGASNIMSDELDELRQAPSDLAVWEAFVTSKTAEERCRTWLALVCGRVLGAEAAAVLIENPSNHTYVPMAVWPKAGPELGRLGAVVEAALRERRGMVKPAPTPSNAMHIAYPLMVEERIAGVVALEAKCPENEVGTVLREIHWGSAWLANLLAGRELSEALRARERAGSVLEAMAVTLRSGKLQLALFEVANTLRQHFGCARVAIGLVRQATVKLAALSEAATFEKHTSLVKAYEQAMEEVYDEHRPVLAPVPEGGADIRAPKHEDLRAISGGGAALSYPLTMGARCIGVVTLERERTPFCEDDLVWLEAFSALAAPIVEQRRAAERGALHRLGEDIRGVLERIFGPRHLTWKVATAAVLMLTVSLVLVPIEYRVSAKTVIEGEVQRVVAAPFEGFIGAAYVRAGDTVKATQPLAQLDDRELRIEEARWSSERDQYESRLREAMANRDLTAMQVIGAQLRQASAQLALVSERIARARLIAPFDGIVVSGDLSQQIGAPVEVGKKLFEIAPLQSYRIILQVDEREIRHVQMGQRGRLVMTGIAGEPMDFKVAKVTPVATAQEGKNFFQIEAVLAQASPRLRPGMEGIGKIEVGSRSLWWVLTHSFSEWLILAVWVWIP